MSSIAAVGTKEVCVRGGEALPRLRHHPYMALTTTPRGNIVQIIMARKDYVFLYEKAAAGAKEAFSKQPMPTLTGEEQRRLDGLEEDLPLQTIVMFRTMARREVRSWNRFKR